MMRLGHLKPLVLSEADVEFVKKNATAVRKWFEMGLDQWEALVFSHFTVYFNISAHYFILKVKKLRHQETISTTTSREGRNKFHV